MCLEQTWINDVREIRKAKQRGLEVLLLDPQYLDALREILHTRPIGDPPVAIESVQITMNAFVIELLARGILKVSDETDIRKE